MSAVIEIEGLRKNFGKKVVLDEVTLQVDRGAVYGLVGANGVGKTTTLKILLNMLPMGSGRAEILGVASPKLKPVDFTRIGYVSENQRLPEWMSVGYFLNYLKDFYPKWDNALCAQMLKQMDLPTERKLGDLSRGMKMKAALVSSLAYRPDVLILDEPFSGLDPLVRDEFVEGLLEQAGDMTILLSSHDLAEMESFASHIGFMESGRMQFSEEIAALTARFREIQVTLTDTPAPPTPWPQQWLVREASAAVCRFVDSAYRAGETESRVRALFPQVRDLQVTPMTLRQIFVALAKSERLA